MKTTFDRISAMSAEQRQAALHKFREEPKVKVLLLS